MCKECGKVKPIEDFPVAGIIVPGKPRYRGYKCKSCTYIWAAQRLRNQKANNPALRAKMLKRDKDRHAKHRKLVLDHYGRSCECCGESNECFLTVDHIVEINSKKKRQELGHNGIYQWLVRNNFPLGFRIMCYNCNCGRSKYDGVCPHKFSSQTMAEASSRKCGETPDPHPGKDIVGTESRGSAAGLTLLCYDFALALNKGVASIN